MALTQHLDMLKKRHSAIDLKILAENARPWPDESMLTQLKKRKLSLKDDIDRLSYAQDAA